MSGRRGHHSQEGRKQRSGDHLELGRIGYVGQLVEVEPVLGLRAVEVVLPVADAELLVEGGVVGAHVGDAAAVLVTHVEELAVELLVGVEAHGPVRAVEREGDIGEFLPPLGTMQGWHGVHQGHGD